MSLSTTALFCCLTDFAETFEDWERHQLIPTQRKRHRAGKLSLGEMLFIMVLFHLSPFKDFKHFWIHGVEQKYRDCFGNLTSYGRFVALMPRLFTLFCVLMHSLSGEQNGVQDHTGQYRRPGTTGRDCSRVERKAAGRQGLHLEKALC